MSVPNIQRPKPCRILAWLGDGKIHIATNHYATRPQTADTACGRKGVDAEILWRDDSPMPREVYGGSNCAECYRADLKGVVGLRAAMARFLVRVLYRFRYDVDLRVPKYIDARWVLGLLRRGQEGHTTVADACTVVPRTRWAAGAFSRGKSMNVTADGASVQMSAADQCRTTRSPWGAVRAWWVEQKRKAA